MDTKKEDLRSIRTKKHLRIALCELMCNKSVKEISIKELAEKSEISRCTFYLYYDNIYDMVNSIQNEMLENYREGIEIILNKNLDEKATIQEIISFSFQSTADNLPFSKLFYSDDNQNYTNRFANMLINEVDLKSKVKSLEDLNAMYFYTYGTLSLIRNWILNDMPQPVEEMVKLVYHLIYD